MKIVNIQAAKTHLSRLVDAVAEGEEIVLAKAGKPLVRLVPYAAIKKPRVHGLMAGQGWEAPDCWAPDEKVLDASVEGPLYHGAVEEPPAGNS
jgi:prevent-host-death family protein